MAPGVPRGPTLGGVVIPEKELEALLNTPLRRGFPGCVWLVLLLLEVLIIRSNEPSSAATPIASKSPIVASRSLLLALRYFSII